MKKIMVLIAAGFLISINLAASNHCSCQNVEKSKSSHDELISYLEKTDLEYVSQIKINAVRGVLSASYYYCDENHGFLLVKLHDQELIYKDVPLETWFGLKFAESSNTFYKEEIKYKYITT